MFDLIKKSILTGVGLAAITKDKAEELAKDIAKAGKLSEKEGKDLTDDLLKKSEKARRDLEVQVEKLIKDTLKKMNIVTRDEFLSLTKQIEKLEQVIKEKGSQE